MVGIRLLRMLGVANERFVMKVVTGSQKWKVGPQLFEIGHRGVGRSGAGLGPLQVSVGE